jgi:hypothetical protein
MRFTVPIARVFASLIRLLGDEKAGEESAIQRIDDRSPWPRRPREAIQIAARIRPRVWVVSKSVQSGL